MQKLFDELSNGWRAKRSLTQMTIGKMLKILETYPKEQRIEKLVSPHSYRGYYSDLSFEKVEGEQTVVEFINLLKSECLNKTFVGYKGGDFTMDEHTPLWIAEYSSCGEKITDIKDGDILIFETDKDEA